MSIDRRGFLQALGSAAAVGACDGRAAPAPEGPGAQPYRAAPGPPAGRADFPALQQRVAGRELVYLDSAATTQRPVQVIDAIAGFYRHDNANPGAALHTLARRAHERLEAARRTAAEFIGASDPEEIVFTRGTTEAINLVAAAWGGAHLRLGDEILVSVAEHASNLVPWQLVARRTGARLEAFEVGPEGRFRLDDFDRRLTRRTRLVACTHVSNVLGIVNPVELLCERAHAAGAVVLVDAAQSVPHLPVDVQRLGCDFLAFSGHKMLGPTGVGVLWGRRELLEATPPYQGGSNMAHELTLDPAALEPSLAHGGRKFAAGTPNLAGPVGLAAAMRYLGAIGFDPLRAHERTLIRRATAGLASVPGLRLLGHAEPEERVPVFSFTLEGVPAAGIVRTLDRLGIAVRGGDLAALPLLRRFGTATAARASCYLYTDVEEVDALVAALHELARRRSDRKEDPR